MIRITLVAAAALATALAGYAQEEQEAGRRLRFAHIGDDQTMMEVATILRSIAGVEHLNVDKATREIVFRAEGEKRKVAEWIFDQLDRPAPSQRARNAELVVSGGETEGTVRVYFSPRQPETLESLQEIATIVRATVEIRRLFTCNAFGAIVIRGTAKQAEAAQWLLARLRPDNGAAAAAAEWQLDRPEGTVRVVALKRPKVPAEQQDLATVLRGIVDLRWVFIASSSNAMVIRGVPGKVAAGEWLIARVEDGASPQAQRHAFTLAEDDVNRVYPVLEMRAYKLPAVQDPARFDQLAAKLRFETTLRRVFVHRGARLIAVRGTAGQIVEADRMAGSW